MQIPKDSTKKLLGKQKKVSGNIYDQQIINNSIGNCLPYIYDLYVRPLVINEDNYDLRRTTFV